MKEKKFKRMYEWRDKELGTGLSIILIVIGYFLFVSSITYLSDSFYTVMLVHIFGGLAVLGALLQNTRIYFKEIKNVSNKRS